jgi:hypothetical protein
MYFSQKRTVVVEPVHSVVSLFLLHLLKQNKNGTTAPFQTTINGRALVTSRPHTFIFLKHFFFVFNSFIFREPELTFLSRSRTDVPSLLRPTWQPKLKSTYLLPLAFSQIIWILLINIISKNGASSTATSWLFLIVLIALQPCRSLRVFSIALRHLHWEYVAVA